jgi:hypothetical protein
MRPKAWTVNTGQRNMGTDQLRSDIVQAITALFLLNIFNAHSEFFNKNKAVIKEL